MAARLCAPCTVCCDATGDFFFPEDRPSPIFSTFAIIINLVMFVWSIVDLTHSCVNATQVWLILGVLNAAINIAFAIYLYQRFAYKVRKDGATASHAACHLFMYDWGVCLYILFSVWLIVWIVMAGIRWNDYRDDDETTVHDQCAYGLGRGVIIFCIYLVVGSFLMACSVCTEACRKPRWARNPSNTTYAAQPGQVVGHQQQQAGYHQQPPPAEHHGMIGRVQQAVFGHHHQPTAANPAMHGTQAPQAPSYYTTHQPAARNPAYVAA